MDIYLNTQKWESNYDRKHQKDKSSLYLIVIAKVKSYEN